MNRRAGHGNEETPREAKGGCPYQRLSCRDATVPVEDNGVWCCGQHGGLFVISLLLSGDSPLWNNSKNCTKKRH